MRETKRQIYDVWNVENVTMLTTWNRDKSGFSNFTFLYIMNYVNRRREPVRCPNTSSEDVYVGTLKVSTIEDI